MTTIWVVVDRTEEGWTQPLVAFQSVRDADDYCLVHNAEGGSPLYVFPIKLH